MKILLAILTVALGLMGDAMAFTLKSSAFKNEGEIPSQYTCEGGDEFPTLNWEGAPDGTVSFAIICDDPDVPETLREKVLDLVWDHFVIFNIPSTQTSLESQCPKGATCGKNSWGRNDWGGPCPPNPKPHRYFFKIYALDAKLGLGEDAGKHSVLAAMKGHILGEAVLMGTYIKSIFK